MNWITIAWSMEASACLTLAFMHLVIWVRERSNLGHLLFSMAALSVAGVAAGELALMRSTTPEQFGLTLRWSHVPVCLLIVSVVGFVRVYFGTGRMWLAYLACAVRLLALIVNFCVWPNLHYTTITGLYQVHFAGGESVAVAVGVRSPWALLGLLGSLLFVVFVIDSTIAAWRRGSPRERRRALFVGGSLIFAVLAAVVQSQLVLNRVVDLPYLISLPFMVPLLVMGYELGSDVVRAARLARALQVSRNELRTSEQRMNLAARAAGMGLWEWDIDADKVWVSEEARALFGIDRDAELSFDTFIAAVHPVDREPLENAFRKVREDGADYDAEFRVTLSDGNMHWFALRGKVQRNGEKRRLMRGVSIDITQRRQAEELFRLVVQAAPNAMIMVNAQGTIVLVNAQAEAIFGYARDEMVGRPIDMLVSNQGRATHRADFESYFSAPHRRDICVARELSGQRKDGSEVPLEVGLNPIERADGALVLATITDVTRQRQAERESAQQRNQLAHLSRVTMLGELSGSIAHELNQPLTAILSNAQAAQRFLTQEPADPQELQEILKDIIEADNRASETIHRLRRLFTNGQVQHQPIDMNAMVREVLQLLNSDLINNMVTATTELANELPSMQVDRVQIQQVLINLIVNACDAMVDVSATERTLILRTDTADDGRIHVSIQDRGSGIAADRLETIFKPFVSSKLHGMGLGLAVSQTIVSAHGGRLWATNNPDRGATFHLALPAAVIANS